MLSRVASDVVGAEKIRVSDSKSVEVDLTNFPAMRRQKTVWDLARFTSDSASSHLLSFGEYAAMYLAAWSSRIWRSLPEAGAVIKPVSAGVDGAVKDHLTEWEKCAKKKAEKEKDPTITFASMKTPGFIRKKTAVEVYRTAVPKAARALANCATYMIFDDHEVTDDWNLNKRWQNRVYTREFGLDVVRNGVMAYAVFQGWGNEPKEFEKASTSGANSNKDLLDETEKVFQGTGPFPHASAQLGRLDEMVGTAGAPAKKLAKFHYRVDGPVHRVVVLDTRTRRSFKGQGLIPPNLLGSTLDQQVPKGPFADGRQLLVVVSPVPVLGPYLIETIGQPVAQIFQDFKVRASPLLAEERDPCNPVPAPTGAEKYDAEAWIGDEEALEKLLARLAPYEHAVILSGDVHYACSLALDYWRKGVTNPSRIVQLTSSPSRNNFKPFVEALLRSSALLQQYQTGPKPERLAWTGKSSIALPAEVSVGPARRARLKRSPSLVPARTWPAGTTIPADKPPDWRWRLHLQRDQRPDTERPTALRAQLLPEELDPSAPLAGYRAIATRHTHAAFTHFDHLRQMVFTPNLGLVDFAGGNGSLQVTHTLLSHDAPDSTTAAPNTIHEIPLTPTTDPPPELVTE
jgi:hypothetical protein